MKYIKIFFAISLIAIFVLSESKNVSAMNTGFETEEISQDKQDEILDNINLIFQTHITERKAIECFDVNEYGLIAMGSQEWSKKTVSIYDSAGEFKYAYSFNSSGDIGVEWDGNDLIIYFVRSDIAVLVDSSGECKEVLKIKDTTENNSYWYDFVFAKKRNVGEQQYVMKNDMGILNVLATSYSQVVIIDSKGETKMVYDVNDDKFIYTVAVLIAVFFIIIIITVVLIQTFQKTQKE